MSEKSKNESTGSRSTTPPSAEVRSPLLDKAMRLFDYLIRVQQQRATPVRMVDAYRTQGGAVFWLDEMPEHEAFVSAHRKPDLAPDDPFLVAERVAHRPPPEPAPDLRPWLSRLDDFQARPTVAESIVVDLPPDADGEGGTTVVRLEDRPDVSRAFETWLADWDTWAEAERDDEAARAAYRALFKAGEQVAASADELELVLGVGCLAWRPPDHDQVRRHLLTVPVTMEFDDQTGRLTFVIADAGGGLSVELEMLEAGKWPDRERLQLIRSEAESFVEHPLDRDALSVLLQRLTNNFGTDGEYSDAVRATPPAAAAVVSYAPALILRKRSNVPLLRVFQRIRDQLESTSEVPLGIHQLIDVVDDDVGVVDSDARPAARYSGPMYLPLPANEQQRRIVERVETRANTVVQGPPGTGKTHTIANLLSHLLAQGKRILVTAQTDRALRELRDKLPPEMASLCVSVVGQDRSDYADLKVAVDTLASRAADYDPNESNRRVAGLEAKLDELRRELAVLNRRVVESGERETVERVHGSYSGTLAQIARTHAEQGQRFGWLAEFQPRAIEPCPLTNEEASKLLSLLRNATIQVDGDEARALPEVDAPDAHDFADLVQRERDATAQRDAHEGMRSHPAYGVIAALEPSTRDELRSRVHSLVEVARDLAARREAWMAAALADIQGGKPEVWTHRHDEIAALLDECRAVMDELGPAPDVEVSGSGFEELVPPARMLHDHLERGGKLKGFITPRVVKQASDLLKRVRVDRVPPTTTDLLGRFLLWAQATTILDRMDRLWPTDVAIPDEDTLIERWAWNQGEANQLRRVIELAEATRREEESFTSLGIPRPDWSDLDSISVLGRIVDAATASDAAGQASGPLDQLCVRLTRALGSSPDASSVSECLTAAEMRDAERYRLARRRLADLLTVRGLIDERDRLRGRLSEKAPSLDAALYLQPDEDWDVQLEELQEAWSWCSVGAWIDEEIEDGASDAERQIAGVEDRIRNAISSLTAEQAWSKAVGRLGLREQQNLKSYALAVTKLGKGTGTYAAHRRGEARDALRNCRSAVPAWIMPLYRIADTLEIDRDIFDVVVIDEASQAGLDASFLLYLAKKIVVVGDDRQVSPLAVGLERQQLIDLRKQLLADFDHGHTWENPEVSFFDQSRLRSPDVITLREHFRCVPEIIAFSNRIAYEPDNVPLIPLRQYGTDRLDPIKAVLVEDGYVDGRDGNKVNPPEAERVVEAILGCCADPRYEGKTMGVISLTGPAQADLIEQELLTKLGAVEFKARDLRCGTAPDFQGSERDVMFLSMVVATENGKRPPAQTRESAVQRYNVAGSRAKDQMWVFHSVDVTDLTNRDDMRFQLLDHCYGVLRRSTETGGLGRASDDVRQDPFDSLFEQHVHNAIFDRGYTVVPQWQAHGWSIDLVIVGGNRRIAVECDGERWHGADRFEADLARQRSLERCGWTFFRVRSSHFYRHPHASLEPLWALLDEHDIRPAGWMPSAIVDAEAAIAEPTGDAPNLVAHRPVEQPARAAAVETLFEREEGTLFSSVATGEPQSSSVVGDRAREAPRGQEEGDLQATSSTLDPMDEGEVLVDLAGYVEWDSGRELPDLRSASLEAKVRGLREIVEVEGPILGERLYQLYVKSNGGRRVGRQLRGLLNLASAAAVRSGVLTTDNPLNEHGQGVKTFRRPEQPEVSVRALGPRALVDVPPGELALVLSQLAERKFASEEDLFRAVLSAYGLKKLTERARTRLTDCKKLAGL